VLLVGFAALALVSMLLGAYFGAAFWAALGWTTYTHRFRLAATLVDAALGLLALTLGAVLIADLASEAARSYLQEGYGGAVPIALLVGAYAAFLGWFRIYVRRRTSAGDAHTGPRSDAPSPAAAARPSGVASQSSAERAPPPPVTGSIPASPTTATRASQVGRGDRHARHADRAIVAVALVAVAGLVVYPPYIATNAKGTPVMTLGHGWVWTGPDNPADTIAVSASSRDADYSLAALHEDPIVSDETRAIERRRWLARTRVDYARLGHLVLAVGALATVALVAVRWWRPTP
jgi:hypothetical protein